MEGVVWSRNDSEYSGEDARSFRLNVTDYSG